MLREIRLGDSIFHVEETEMSKRYSDVTRMFSFLNSIGLDNSSVIFDIGANIGMFSLSYASLYKSSKIFSFEPVSSIFKELKNNINLNLNLKKQIQTFNFGLSIENIDMSLSIPSAKQHHRYANDEINCGLYSVHGSGKNQVNAKFITMDNFMTGENSPNSVDFIKIDVEGHEFEVLKGGERTISKFKPIIFMEFNELTRSLSVHSVKSYEDFFKQHNYSLFGLEYGWKEKLTPLKSLEEATSISDVVAIYIE